MVRIVIDPSNPEPERLAEAAAVIRAGGLVAFPTDTLYGLGADPFNPAAVDHVFVAKGRAAGRALPLVAADEEQVVSQLGPIPPLAHMLAERFWPGPLTILIAADAALPSAVTGGMARVAVRVPAHPVARSLCRAANSVLTATSANPSGETATNDPGAVAVALASFVDLLLDAGRTAGGPPSTIVDVTGAEPRLVRAGAIPWEAIQSWRRA